MKYKRLLAEMLVKDITRDDLAKLLGKSRSTINNRFNGNTDFTFGEALAIMEAYFKGFSVEYIFSIGDYKHRIME